METETEQNSGVVAEAPTQYTLKVTSEQNQGWRRIRKGENLRPGQSYLQVAEQNSEFVMTRSFSHPIGKTMARMISSNSASRSSVDQCSVFRIEAHIKEDEDKGLFIDPRAAEYVHYTPTPYVFQPAPATKLL
jgi:hypothetical protein